MRICVSHGTALHYWLRMPNLRRPGERSSRASAVPRRLPGAEETRALFEAFGYCLPTGCDSLDLLVSSQGGRHWVEHVSAHLCSAQLPPGSFVPQVVWGHEVYLSSPELIFLQMAEELEFDQLVYVGYALCSEFRLDDLEEGGCVHREGHDTALTSVAKVRSYLEQLPRGARNRAVALRALEYVRDGARSPREAGIAETLLLPARLGGEGYSKLALNREVRLFDGVDSRGRDRWVTRIPDILVEARDRGGRDAPGGHRLRRGLDALGRPEAPVGHRPEKPCGRLRSVHAHLPLHGAGQRLRDIPPRARPHPPGPRAEGAPARVGEVRLPGCAACPWAGGAAQVRALEPRAGRRAVRALAQGV